MYPYSLIQIYPPPPSPQGALSEQRLRAAWQQGREGDSASPRDSTSTSGGESTLAPARMLQQLSIGPTTPIIDNPVDSQISQPVVPETDVSYGGRVGQWPAHATQRERLGVLPGAQGRRAGRAVLRVHVHQVRYLCVVLCCVCFVVRCLHVLLLVCAYLPTHLAPMRHLTYL